MKRVLKWPAFWPAWTVGVLVGGTITVDIASNVWRAAAGGDRSWTRTRCVRGDAVIERYDATTGTLTLDIYGGACERTARWEQET